MALNKQCLSSSELTPRSSSNPKYVYLKGSSDGITPSGGFLAGGAISHLMVRVVPIPRDPSARVEEQIAAKPARHHFGSPPEMQQRMVQPLSTGRKRGKQSHMEFGFGALSGLSLHQHEEELFKSISLGRYTLGKREGFTMCCEHAKRRGLTTALRLSEMGCSFSAHKPTLVFLDKNTTRICIWSSKEHYLNAQFYSSTFCIILEPLCLCALLYTASPFDLSCIDLCCHLFNNNIIMKVILLL